MIRHEISKKIENDFNGFFLLESQQEAYTYLNCTYTTSRKFISDWWVNINLGSYLLNKNTEERLIMIHVIYIPISPKKYYLKTFGESLSFTLIFPQIPNNWASFDFIENSNNSGGLRINNILRNDTGVYHVII